MAEGCGEGADAGSPPESPGPWTRGIELTPEMPVAEVAALGELAEDAGFEAVLASSHYNNRDPFVALDRVARATEEVLVGSAAENPYETHPVALASRAATLQEASDGRALLGVGAGDRSTLRNLGVERDRPLRRVLETMRVARRLWTGERVDHDGTFAVRNAGLNFSVPPIPTYVAAQGPGMCRMAGKHADGVLVNGSHPRDLAWAAERVAEGAADRADDRDPPHVVAFTSASVAATSDAAREAAAIPVAFITAGAPDPVLDRHGIDADDAAAVGDAIEAGRFGEAGGLVTDAMVDAFAVAGTVDGVADRLRAILDHADGVVVGSPLGPEKAEAIGRLGTALDRAIG